MAVSISLSIAQNSQNIANNTSSVTVKVIAKWTYGSWNGYSKSGWVKIDGTQYSFSSSFNKGQSTSGSQTLYTKTVNVSHNSDGTKKLSCSASYTSGVSSGTVTTSASKTLTTIPRKSTLTVADGTLGTAQTLTISEKASAFNHKLTYSCGDASGYILGSSSATSSTLSTSWTPPITLASQNTTGTSVSIKFTLYTYSGSTSIGSNTYTKTFTIPSSVAPKCTVAVSDPTGHLATYGSYIKGQSKFKVDITATTSYGSAIASYGGSANGQNITAASTTTDVLASSGTLTITASVKDKRGRSGTASTTANVLNYSPASITALTVHRCVSLTDGTEDMQGAYIQIKFSSSVTSLSGKNKATYILNYKKKSDEKYTPVPLNSYENNYAVSNGTYIFAAATDASYDVELTVTDNFDSDTKTASASTAFAIMHWRNEGDGLALGKVAENGGLEIGMKSTLYENMRFAYSEFGEGMLGGTLSDGTEVYNFQPLSENGNCVVGWGNYDRGDGNTNIYSGASVNMYVAGEEKGIFIGRNGNGHTLINYAAADNASNTYLYGTNVEFRTDNTIVSGDVPFGLHALSVGCSSALSLSTSAKKITCGAVYSNGNAVTSGILSASNGGIKVSRKGRYLVGGMVYAENMTAGNAIGANIYIDSSSTYGVNFQTGSRTYTSAALPLKVLSLSANATVYLYASNINSATGDVPATNGTLLTVIALD